MKVVAQSKLCSKSNKYSDVLYNERFESNIEIGSFRSCEQYRCITFSLFLVFSLFLAFCVPLCSSISSLRLFPIFFFYFLILVFCTLRSGFGNCSQQTSRRLASVCAFNTRCADHILGTKTKYTPFVFHSSPCYATQFSM